MAETRPSWRPFPVSHRSIPNLLVSASFSASPVSYSVHLTDLANVWRESLDRKAILFRCLQENTSIDPSDDPENFKELLRWVEAAFDPASPKHADTSLALSSTAPAGAGADAPADLVLEVTCVLPAGFRPLKWPIRLKHGGAPALVADLVLPLAQAQLARSQEVDALLAVIREKDGVISRVVDKLESTGARMEHVFTALVNTGKKRITRAVAEARVKGLAPFDEPGFRRQFRGPGGSQDEGQGDGNGRIKGPVPASDAAKLIDEVFGPVLQRPYPLEYPESPALDGWWNDVKEETGSKARLERKKTAPQTPPPNDVRQTGRTEDDEDDFEVQATPPHLLSARKERSKNLAPADDSTDCGEDETQIPDSNPPKVPTPQRPAATRAKKRIGVIGRRREPEPEPEPEPESEPEPEPETAPEADAETASEGEGDAGAKVIKDGGSETASEVEELAAEPSPKPKRRIGRIGGAREKTEIPALEEDDTEEPAKPAKRAEEDAGEGASKARPARRMGRIEKGADPKQNMEDAVDDGAETRGRTARASEEPAPPARETSEERAARRHQELEEQLAKKAQGPAKKKRRF